ncbi:MAG: thiamine diphosphokinase [Lachnospiraceae bacterium]|nr:thiamine diphosphokinase [Lachnospiraceae bacterium]
MKKAIIVTGGRIDSAFCKFYIKKNSKDIQIAVDSGMRYFYEVKENPDFIIGDFDSVDAEILQYFEQQEGIQWIRLIPEKDDTDTEAAIRLALKEGCTQIHILGATGSRMDHMLGNIQLLGIGLEEAAEIFIVDAHNKIRMINKSIQIKKEEQYGSYVSLIPFTPKVRGLTLKGMKYPLHEYTMVCYNSLGVSNEIVEDVAEISFTEGVLLVLETKD